MQKEQSLPELTKTGQKQTMRRGMGNQSTLECLRSDVIPHLAHVKYFKFFTEERQIKFNKTTRRFTFLKVNTLARHYVFLFPSRSI